jgi:hypothetical protein
LITNPGGPFKNFRDWIRRMARKADAESTAKTPRRKAAETKNSFGGASVPLDSRVVYCGGPSRAGHQGHQQNNLRIFTFILN